MRRTKAFFNFIITETMWLVSFSIFLVAIERSYDTADVFLKASLIMFAVSILTALNYIISKKDKKKLSKKSFCIQKDKEPEKDIQKPDVVAKHCNDVVEKPDYSENFLNWVHANAALIAECRMDNKNAILSYTEDLKDEIEKYFTSCPFVTGFEIKGGKVTVDFK